MQQNMIVPSIISADFSKLGEEIRSVMHAGADMIHFDVMDNHYVPNLTMGPMILKSLKKYFQIPFDVHLMVSPVDEMIRKFAKAGADSITFHPEASNHIDRSLKLIRQLNCKAGLAFNPSTSLSDVEYIMKEIDIILLMSVNPGFGGQTFIETIFKKLKVARKIIDKSDFNIRLAVDGGVKKSNILEVAASGADTFVIGSGIFNESGDYKVIQLLRKMLMRRNEPCLK